MWQGRGSCSGLTQLVKSWESLACLQLCSGSPVERQWKPCSYRLAAQWQRSCSQSAPRCSAGVYWVVGLRKGVLWPTPSRTHPARVASLVVTGLINICSECRTGGPREGTCHPPSVSVEIIWLVMFLRYSNCTVALFSLKYVDISSSFALSEKKH